MFTMKKIWRSAALHLVILALLAVPAMAEETAVDNENHTYTLGAMLPLTGDLSDIGKCMRAAMDMAVEDVNYEYAASGSLSKVQLDVRDTQSDFITAYKAVTDLHEAEVDVVVGPASSSSAYICKDFADEKGMLLISPTSTAAALAIADDNLMRTVVDDSLQAKALATHIAHKGVNKLAVFVLTDIYGQGLLESFATEFKNLSGEFIAAYNMRGAAGAEDIDPFLEDLNMVVQDQLDSGTKPGEIGVLMIVFQQGVTILAEAHKFSNLKDLKWFGSDSLAQNTLITADADAAAFADEVGFVCPAMSKFYHDPWKMSDDRYKAIEERIRQATGMTEVPVYGPLTYDSAVLAARAIMGTGTTDPAFLRQWIRTQAATYAGATGPIDFNAADDRSTPKSYDFWQVRKVSDQYTWTHAGTLPVDPDPPHLWK